MVKVKKYKTNNKTTLNHPAINDCLIYDIETDGLDTETNKIKFIGCYSYKKQKYYIYQPHELHLFQQQIKEHRILIGFNNYNFDGPTLQNETNQFDIDYKICFDCLKVLYDWDRKKSNREAIIKYRGKTLGERLINRKLKTVCETLNFPVTKGDIDYKIFRKNSWTPEELQEIFTYLFYDVDLTRRLFEFYVEYFEPFTHYVDHENIMKFNYIRSSTGSFAYSAFCHLAKLPFEFENDPIKIKEKPINHGGFVLKPVQHYAEGTIIYFDFSSLYPFIYFQCNLFSQTNKEDPNAWHGANFFDVKGYYKTDEIGRVESTLKEVFYTRAKLKNVGDPKELALKIMMNSLYGISGSPVFKSLYNKYTPGDCTSIGRSCLKYAIKTFESNGLPVIYADTDSCFVHVKKDVDIVDVQDIAANIVKHLQSFMPFPDNGFQLKIDEVFDKIWFFSKKFYVGITHDNELFVKGLSIKKNDSSLLGQEIYSELKPIILERGNIKFSKSFFEKLVFDKIKKKPELIAQAYSVKSFDSYSSKSCLHAQIAAEFGEGIHLLIPNKRLGNVGKSKKYCAVSDIDLLDADDLILDKVWSELEPFIEDGE